MRTLHIIAAILVIVGALNWGLVALARFDLVAFLFGMTFGEVSMLTRLVYGLVGLAGVYEAINLATTHHRETPRHAHA